MGRLTIGWFFLGTAVLLPTSSALAQTPPAGTTIIDLRSAEAIPIDRLASELSRCDVVFLGEEHDNDAGHQMQLAIVQALGATGRPLVISLEMFERDVQGTLDDYLAGRIEEPAFLQHARPWKNYAEHYRPIIEHARRQRLPVIAGNVPRRLASDVAAGKPLDPADQAYLPRDSSAPEDRYWHLFRATMSSHAGADSDDKLTQFYRSQCLKDDAMAEAIADSLAVSPHQRPLVIHLCGKFHSDYGLGTAQRVLQREPLLHLGVVSMLSTQEPEGFVAAEHADRAHFLLLVPPQPQEDGSPANETGFIPGGR